MPQDLGKTHRPNIAQQRGGRTTLFFRGTHHEYIVYDGAQVYAMIEYHNELSNPKFVEFVVHINA